jgi:hypothetical protein
MILNPFFSSDLVTGEESNIIRLPGLCKDKNSLFASLSREAMTSVAETMQMTGIFQGQPVRQGDAGDSLFMSEIAVFL